MVPSNQGDQQKIATLNDAFRTTFIGGSICITAGLHAAGDAFVKAALQAVRDFDAFDENNDPNGEHDFGALSLGELRLFWKIDYFDPTMTVGSDDPTDVDATRRVLTVMFVDEY